MEAPGDGLLVKIIFFISDEHSWFIDQPVNTAANLKRQQVHGIILKHPDI